MTPALQTSKRKFYKLLDGLNTSQSSLHGSARQTNKAGDSASSANERSNEPAFKRSRVSLESGQSLDTRPSSVRAERISVSTPSKNTTRPTTSDSISPPRPTPYYQPYSQSAFLERLRTFSDVKVWTYKPSEISEIHWAKRGWVCDSKEVDVVACKGGCEARVVVRLRRGKERAEAFEKMSNHGSSEDTSGHAVNERQEEDAIETSMDWVDEADDPLVTRYKEMTIEGHRDGCLWRKAGCKDDIYRIRMADASVWQVELSGRYESLTNMASALPERLRFPGVDGEEESLSSKITVDAIQSGISSILASAQGLQATASPLNSRDSAQTDRLEGAPGDDLNLTAITLAIFGWQGISPHNIHLATCTRCFQRIGLWLYTSNPANKAMPASNSGIADDNIMRFDLVDLHREHCPWINGESQAGLGQFAGLPAWEILVQLIKGRSFKPAHDRTGQPGGLEATSEFIGVSPKRSREEIDEEDRARSSKLAKLKRAFSIKKGKKVENRKSWRNLKG